MKKVFIYGQKKQLSNYANAVKKLGALPIVTTDLRLTQNCDSLILAGGGDVFSEFYNEQQKSCFDLNLKRDLAEFYLISYFIQKNLPILGICRGLQIINVYFGGNLYQSNPNVKLQYNPSYDLYHSISFIKNEFFNSFSLNLVNSAHRQSIKKLGSNLTVLAISSDETIEAIASKTHCIYATQFHPERLFKHNLYDSGLAVIAKCLQL